MSFEKRAILAVLASLGIFLLYDAVYLGPRLDKQRERQAQVAQQLVDSLASAGEQVVGGTQPTTLVPYDEERAAAKDTVAAEDATAGATQEAAPSPAEPSATEADLAAERKEFVIESDLWEITLTNIGAEVTSVKLLEHETAGRPVELFAQDPDWRYPRALNVSLGSDNDENSLNDMAFTASIRGRSRTLEDGDNVEVTDQPVEIVLTHSAGNVERFYRFYPGRYDFETGVRFPESRYPDVNYVAWGMGRGLTATEENVKDDWENFKATVKVGEEVHKLKPSHFDTQKQEAYAGSLAWAAQQTKYFAAVMIPEEVGRAEVFVSGDKEGHRVSNRIHLPIVPRNNRYEQQITVYMGPLDADVVKELGRGLDTIIEMGWTIVRPVSWLVLWSLIWMYKFIPNYGVVIIIISVLTKVLFYRLTHKSFKSMKEMQELQPRLQALKEKYKDDRQKLSQETMKLYKEAGVNPLGGCLPMLLQMPVFIALFNVLRYTIEVRNAPFVGWITDLSQQEVLFQLPISLPFIGDGFSLLPVLMGASMFLQTKLGGSMTGQPGSSATPPGFNTMLPIVFTVLFYKMPSGLVLYWIVNTGLSIAQQYYINKDSQESKAGAEEPAPAPKKRRLKTKER